MTLHNQLHSIDQQADELQTKREQLCQEIHEAAVETERQRKLKYKTTIQNGDYGLYNDRPATFVFSRHEDRIMLVDASGIRHEFDMDNEEKTELFTKFGNVFDVIRKNNTTIERVEK